MRLRLAYLSTTWTRTNSKTKNRSRNLNLVPYGPSNYKQWVVSSLRPPTFPRSLLYYFHCGILVLAYHDCCFDLGQLVLYSASTDLRLRLPTFLGSYSNAFDPSGCFPPFSTKIFRVCPSSCYKAAMGEFWVSQYRQRKLVCGCGPVVVCMTRDLTGLRIFFLGKSRQRTSEPACHLASDFSVLLEICTVPRSSV